MLNRRHILFLSYAIAAIFYAGLFVIAPRISMMSASTFDTGGIVRVRMLTLEESPKSVTQSPSAVVNPGEGAGEMSDLLRRTHEVLEPWDVEATSPSLEPEKATETSLLQDVRDYDFAPPELLQGTVDAKILEISREAVRNNINVARQFVRPGSENVLEEGDYPVLRTDRIVDDYQPRALPGIEAETGINDSGGEANVLAPAMPLLELSEIIPEEEATPPIKVEDLQARAAITESQSKAREESGYSFMDDLLHVQLETWNPGNGEASYFKLAIKPRGTDLPTLPKDVTFVLDASSSISQNKLIVSARGIRTALDRLRPEDYFNVVLFRDSPDFFQPNRVAASREMLDAAKNFLENLESRGETDLYKSILPVVQETPRANAAGIVIIVSDGRPTIGIQDSRAIINGLSRDNQQRNSVFAFGGGNTVNSQMLDLLAYRNKGDAYVVEDFNSIDKGLGTFFSRLNKPLLIGVQADFATDIRADAYPKIIPDFYQDKSLTLYGRFQPEEDETFVVRVTGVAADGKKEVVFKTKAADAAKGTEAIARNWAFQKAYHLIGEMSQKGESPERLAELRTLSAKYKIRTSYDE